MEDRMELSELAAFLAPLLPYLVKGGIEAGKAIEVKASDRFQENMLSGLKKFRADYPEAELFLLYGGNRKMYVEDVTVLPLQEACLTMDEWMK